MIQLLVRLKHVVDFLMALLFASSFIFLCIYMMQTVNMGFWVPQTCQEMKVQEMSEHVPQGGVPRLEIGTLLASWCCRCWCIFYISNHFYCIALTFFNIFHD